MIVTLICLIVYPPIITFIISTGNFKEESFKKTYKHLYDGVCKTGYKKYYFCILHFRKFLFSVCIVIFHDMIFF